MFLANVGWKCNNTRFVFAWYCQFFDISLWINRVRREAFFVNTVKWGVSLCELKKRNVQTLLSSQSSEYLSTNVFKLLSII